MPGTLSHDAPIATGATGFRAGWRGTPYHRLAVNTLCDTARDEAGTAVKIVDIRPTTVTIPLEAPLRHSNGAHWGRFVRTIVEVEADNGLIGLGEMGGGGQSAEAAVAGLKPYLLGHDPARTEALRWMLANPTASLYNN